MDEKGCSAPLFPRTECSRQLIGRFFTARAVLPLRVVVDLGNEALGFGALLGQGTLHELEREDALRRGNLYTQGGSMQRRAPSQTRALGAWRPCS